MTHNEDELTPQERAALSSLPREMPVSHELEERVARALRQKGHFRPAYQAHWRVAALRIAAAFLLFAAGAATERYLLSDRGDSTASRAAPTTAAGVPATRAIRAPEVEMWL